MKCTRVFKCRSFSLINVYICANILLMSILQQVNLEFIDNILFFTL